MSSWMANAFLRPRRQVRDAWHCRAASVSVEFALITPVLLILILGTVDYGRAMFDKMELLSAVRSGAQLALAKTTLNTAYVQNAVVAATNNSITTSDVTTTQFCECADESTITCGATCTDGSDNRYFLTISATQSFNAFYLTTPLTLSESVTIRIQ